MTDRALTRWGAGRWWQAGRVHGPVEAAEYEVTVATWNVKGKVTPEMLALLGGLAPDVLFLQEVTKDTSAFLPD